MPWFFSRIVVDFPLAAMTYLFTLKFLAILAVYGIHLMGRVLKCKQKVTSHSPKFGVNIAPVYAAGTTLLYI